VICRGKCRAVVAAGATAGQSGREAVLPVARWAEE
jgi:hypothetical protein